MGYRGMGPNNGESNGKEKWQMKWKLGYIGVIR